MDIKGKIRALLRLAENAGATEAEALSAAAKARELMDRYQVTVTAEELQDSAAADMRDETVILGKKRIDRIIILAPAIAKFCDVRCWKSGPRAVFLGLSADAEMASYLMRLARDARDAEWTRYQRSDEFRDLKIAGWSPARLKTSFTDGMVTRVADRLTALKRESEVKFSNSRALVPVKNALITTEMARRKIRLGNASRMASSSRNAAYAAGQDAGGRVNLSRPVGGTKVAGQIT